MAFPFILKRTHLAQHLSSRPTPCWPNVCVCRQVSCAFSMEGCLALPSTMGLAPAALMAIMNTMNEEGPSLQGPSCRSEYVL